MLVHPLRTGAAQTVAPVLVFPLGAAISSSHDDPSSVEIEYTAADCLYPTLSSSYTLSMINTPEGSLVLKESPASCL